MLPITRRNHSSRWKKAQLLALQVNQERDGGIQEEIQRNGSIEDSPVEESEKDREKPFSPEKMKKSPSYHGTKMNISIPPSPLPGPGSGQQDDGEKHAGASFEYDELFDLNSPTFWRDWEAAGGDPDEYFKETLPNYGLVSTLFMTISIPGSIYPPTFNLEPNPPSKDKFYVSLYVIFMCITTMTSLMSTLMAIGIHQQFVNAYSKSLRVDFAAKYGYLVGVLTSLLVLGAMSLWGAMTCVFIVTYNEIAAYIGLAIMLIGGWAAVVGYSSMTKWNANNYSRQMVIDLKRIQQLKQLQQQLQKVALNGELPSTPMAPLSLPYPLVPQSSARRRSSRPTVFSLSREKEEIESLQSLQTHQNPQPLSSLSLHSSVIRPSMNHDHLFPWGHGQGRGNGTVVPLPNGISQIREENDAILSGIDSSPVQYGNRLINMNGYQTE